MEEDVDGDLADIEALNYDDLDSVSKLQKTQRFNDIMQVIIFYPFIFTSLSLCLVGLAKWYKLLVCSLYAWFCCLFMFLPFPFIYC